MQLLKRICVCTLVTMLLATTACGSNEATKETDVSNNNITASVDSSEDGEGAEGEILGPKDVIIQEVEKLLNADKETVERYFGESDVYRGIDIKDRIAVAKVNFIEAEIDETQSIVVSDLNNIEKTVSSPEEAKRQAEEEKKQRDAGLEYGSKEVIVHICNMDYNKTAEAIAELTDRIKTENPKITEDELNNKVTNEVAARAQNGEFDIHITIPVTVEYVDGVGKVALTEEFKAALTGGWYNPTGAKFKSGDCPIREEAQKEIENKDKKEEKEEKEENNTKSDSKANSKANKTNKTGD